MSLRYITAPDPQHLLRAAASGFLQRVRATAAAPFPTPNYLLALRQGGLRDELLELAAQADVRGWFDPPLCIFHELARWLGVRERPTLGDYERAVHLAAILRETGSEVFAHQDRSDRFVDSVDTLFGELLSNGVDADHFQSALSARPERDDFQRGRDADLARAYHAYIALLNRLGKGDGRDEWHYCASEIAGGRADLASALRGRREIRIFGLADLRRGWKTLLDALANTPALDSVIVYSTSRNLDLGVPREDLTQSPTDFAAIASRLFADNESENEKLASPQPLELSAPDVDREHHEVARRIRVLVDTGVAPSRIAVVSRKARPHLEHAVAALERVGVPALARQRFGLTTIPAIRAIDVLLKAAADGWTRAGLVEIGCQPYLDTGIDPTVVNYIGFRRRVAGLNEWELALRKLERECRDREEKVAAGEELDERASPPPPSDVVVRTREAFGKFASIARPLDGERTIHGWVEWLRAALDRDSFDVRKNAHALAEERFDVVRRDLAALDGVQEILNEWGEALSALPASSHGKAAQVAEFQKELRAFLAGDAAIWTLAREGVNVLEGPAAAYRTFDHVFLVGLQASAFPAPAPQSSILDESERDELARAGLPLDSPAVWDERERELFRVLTASARKTLVLSYSRLDDLGRDVIPSSFVEAVKDVAECGFSEIQTSKVTIEGVPLYASAQSLDQAVHGATIERLRAADELSLYNGLVESTDLRELLASHFGDDKIWSPTQLEEFAKCPWAYFSKRLLTVEKLDDPDEDIDPATRGSVLHLALRHFYDAAKGRVGGPVFLRTGDLEWAGEMMASALDRALGESAWRWLGHPVLQPAHRAEFLRLLRGFIEWEAELHEKMLSGSNRTKAPKMVRTGADEHEVAFDDITFERDGVRIRYRGSIDRVDVSVDDRAAGEGFVAAIDYKSSKWSTPGGGKPGAWEDGVVLQVPLYAHALRTLRPGQDIARVEYQTLKSPERVHSLELYTVDRASGVERDSSAADKWQAALDHAIAHVRRARDGEFPAKPPESCNCPPWCHGRDICRIPGGPRNNA